MVLFQRRSLLLVLLLLRCCDPSEANHQPTGRILSIEDYGAIADDSDNPTIRRKIFCQELQNLIVEEDLSKCIGNDDADHKHNTTTTSIKKPDNNRNKELALNNTAAFSRAFRDAQPGDTIVVPDGKVFTLFGGVVAENRNNFTLDVAGSLRFIHDVDVWPQNITRSTFFDGHRTYEPGISVINCTNVTLTSTSKTLASVRVDFKRYMVHLIDSQTHHGGVINGNGKGWWDDVLSGRIKERTVTRPRLIHLIECEDVLVEKLTLLNSPYWTLTIEAIRAEIRHVNVLVDRELQGQLLQKHYDKNNCSTSSNSSFLSSVSSIELKDKRKMKSVKFPIPIDDLPDWIGRKMRQPQDLNTDGIDPYGKDIWIHDCIIQNADDSIAVKPSKRGRQYTRLPNCTTNVTMSNLILTGFGASVGSVGPVYDHNCVDNITFRNITMPGTARGIYIKSNGANCINQSSQITNIRYEHVNIIEPFWWAIWIGPQQQHQPGDSLGYNCPIFWPLPGSKLCPTQGCTQFENITLRHIKIFHPLISPGVIWGNATNPMKNIVIEDLNVDENKYKVWHGKWPFHNKNYPWHGTIKCRDAAGTYNGAHPAPACLSPAES